MTIGQAWRQIRDQFREAGFSSPEYDARLLAEMSFGLKGVELINRERDPAEAAALDTLDGLAARRLGGEPVARMVGEKDFYGLTFSLAPETLVPRPETEMLVDFALTKLPRGVPSDVLDLGTGTGCIAISVLTQAPQSRVVAIDVSPEAIACAAGNAARHGVAERFDGRTGSWFSPLRPGESFDLIVSNPPYIESAVIPSLAPEVREHDPVLALDGGRDGLNAYRSIAFSAPSWLKPGGQLALEIGSGQGPQVASLLTRAGLREVVVKKDLAGLDRMVIAHHVQG